MTDAAVAEPKLNPLVIQLPKLNIQFMATKLVGDSSLIVHRFDEKAKKQILDKQMKRARAAKEPKNPTQEYLDSLYQYPGGGYGFPAGAFKAAAIDACSHVDGMTKVQARGAFHVIGEMAKIEGDPRMREDMVRIAMGTTDIRYRAEFPAWSTTLKIRFNANVMRAEQIVNLFNTAGFAIGVGEWRPQKDGIYGMFHVE